MKIVYFLYLCMILVTPCMVFGVTTDLRTIVEWSDYPQIVHIKANVGDYITTCTGQYVAPNIILTAAHCVLDDYTNNIYSEITAVTYNGKKCFGL